MRRPILALAALLLLSGVPAAAQQAVLVADLLQDVSQVEQKMLSLAKAMPADKFDWRPGAGVRSFGEVVMHVAADNYLIPATIGIAPDPSTGIKGDDYKTAVSYEQRKLGREAAIAEMEKSFAHLKRALQGTSAERLAQKVKLFGQDFTVQQTWILAATHLHEHLGQAIAYARSNSVKPPWSQ
ncbi:MAG TPA: DinB family protein [Gemmatimonadaceae bacterium]|nr:DinB family protein [Gemmatimonadaceae bacterium]